jgi:hypothetical protein
MQGANPTARLTEYELRHLPAHLEQGGRWAELHQLLAVTWKIEQPGRPHHFRERNAWYEAKNARGDLAGYLSDLSRAWRLAETISAGGNGTQAVGLQARYALIAVSLNQISSNIAPALMRALGS